jgi:hypothetical protein
MSLGRSGAAQGDFDRARVRAVGIAFTLMATGVALGGALAIVAASNGASTGASVAMMTPAVLCGAVAAFWVLRSRLRASEGEALCVSSLGIRRAAWAHDRAVRHPDQLLEHQLSARYGVPVKRVAWHVWRIDGELVEATLDPATGRLVVGGRELSL